MDIDTDAAAHALGRIAKDVRKTTGLRARLDIEVSGIELGFVARDAGRVVARGSRSVDPRSAGTENALAVHLADLVQHDYVIERLFRAWPRCPDHEHVLEPELLLRGAVWRCPQRGPVAPIGQLSGG